MAKIKWKTLRHKGPAFPPAYKRLPKTVKLRYGPTPIAMSPFAEESAVLFAKIMISSPKEAKNKTFRNNFFVDFKKLLSKKDQKRVTVFGRLNFSGITSHLKRLQRNDKDRAKVLAQKRKAQELKAKHGVCKVNGRAEPVGNFFVEPPGIFRGRGDNRKRGRIKLRIQPKDVTINVSRGVRVPAPNGRWKSVVHDQEASWLAKYKNNLGQDKYIMLGQSSKLKSASDRKKYELARALGDNIYKIRRKYREDFDSRDEKKRQMAVALYFIDYFALRVGNEKGEDAAADTVGCCTLLKNNIVIKGSKEIRLDFVGKDVIRYKKDHKVLPKVVELLKQFTRNKAKTDELFDTINANDLNAYLKQLAPRLSLSAKIFRTYHASTLLQKELRQKVKSKAPSQASLLRIFALANLKVAQLCNHKKAIPKNHKKILKGFQKKVAASDEKLRFLKSKLKEVKTSREKTAKVLTQIKKEQDKNITLNTKLELQTKGEGFALNTAKMNYLDPRIIIDWCRKHGIPEKKVFSNVMLKKYAWAMKEIKPLSRFLF